jgi:crotonyl-CoA reductase
MHQYDNRYLWMNLKRIVGSHFANYREAWEANDLVQRRAHPPTSEQDVSPGGGRPGRVRRPPQDLHQGKVGVLALAPETGLGATDLQKRQALLTAINRFPRPPARQRGQKGMTYVTPPV